MVNHSEDARHKALEKLASSSTAVTTRTINFKTHLRICFFLAKYDPFRPTIIINTLVYGVRPPGVVIRECFHFEEGSFLKTLRISTKKTEMESECLKCFHKQKHNNPYSWHR